MGRSRQYVLKGHCCPCVVCILFLCLHFSFPESCQVSFSELQSGRIYGTTANEFIELQASADCTLPLDLSPYTIVLWNGGNKKTLSTPYVMKMLKFAQHTSCQFMKEPLLVVGHPKMSSVVPMTKFCSFADFPTSWPHLDERNDYWIDKGNRKINALTLYSSLPKDALRLSIKITNQTAYRDRLVDVLFYKYSGGDNVLQSFLLPEYAIGPPYFPLYYLNSRNSRQNVLPPGFSFSRCCEQRMTKWPLAYKWSNATPGMANECGNDDYAVIGGEDGPGINLPVELLNTCDVNGIEQYFSGPPINTSSAQKTTILLNADNRTTPTFESATVSLSLSAETTVSDTVSNGVSTGQQGFVVVAPLIIIIQTNF